MRLQRNGVVNAILAAMAVLVVRPTAGAAYTKMFEGECDGNEILMYEGASMSLNGDDSTSGDNPGASEEERTHACAVACLTKKTPLNIGGTWRGFVAKGFAVARKNVRTGRCWCESSNSATCRRTSNSFTRYDFQEAPTKYPTTAPTNHPTTSPSMLPTTSPSMLPTTSPSMPPTSAPSMLPTTSPSMLPTTSPSILPTTSPTKYPTTSPTEHPTTSPSMLPTTSPTLSTVTPATTAEDITGNVFAKGFDATAQEGVATTTLRPEKVGGDLEMDSPDASLFISLVAISEVEKALGQSIKEAAVGEKEAKVIELLKAVGESEGSALLSKQLFLAVSSASKANPPNNKFTTDVQKLFAYCNTKDNCDINQTMADALSVLKCHGGLDGTAKDRMFELELAVTQTDGIKVRECEQMVRLELGLDYSDFDEAYRVLEVVHKPAVDAACLEDVGTGHSASLVGHFATEFVQVGRAHHAAGGVIFVLIHKSEATAAVTQRNEEVLESELTTRYKEYFLQTPPPSDGRGSNGGPRAMSTNFVTNCSDASECGVSIAAALCGVAGLDAVRRTCPVMCGACGTAAPNKTSSNLAGGRNNSGGSSATVISVAALATIIVIGAAVFALWRARYRQRAAAPPQYRARGGMVEKGEVAVELTFANRMYDEVGEGEHAYEEVGAIESSSVEVGISESSYEVFSEHQQAAYDIGLRKSANPERQANRISALDDELPPTPGSISGVPSNYAVVNMQQLYAGNEQDLDFNI